MTGTWLVPHEKGCLASGLQEPSGRLTEATSCSVLMPAGCWATVGMTEGAMKHKVL